MGTNVFSAKDIKRGWYLIDAKDQILGRLATQVARLLMGKQKPQFVPYLDTGDFVVVVNAGKVKVSGKKAMQKQYVHHSGYPGGLKQESFDKLLQRKPNFIIEHAVKGMLPKNKLGKKMIKKLKVFADENHPFKKQLELKENK
ncbi:50S ribosomal protein L13 [Candidatus Daviesbacteria bacterium]|nr:50S ribosomal protein L13 [Candidatus Daviesbacteria bacterium]